MSRNPREVIASYLTELLTDEPVVVAAVPASATDLLDQGKRERLQALLNDQFRITEVTPEIESEALSTSKEQSTGEIVGRSKISISTDLADNDHLAESTNLRPPLDTHKFDQLAQAKAALEWAPNGRPHWAQTEFEVLLFQVAGLTLAAPLLALGQIYPVTAKLAPVIGQAVWFMGLQPTSIGLIRTINTALWVMPERYDPECVANFRYLVTIADMDWGLVVDTVRHPSLLQPDDVNWRGQRSKRPWLAGTVKSAMCALLDIPQIGLMLTQAASD